VTPLAHKIARMLANARVRTVVEQQGQGGTPTLKKWLYGAHFFEVTNCLETAYAMTDQLREMESDEVEDIMAERIFLPSPQCWIELAFHNTRYAYYLEQSSEDGLVIARVIGLRSLSADADLKHHELHVVPLGTFSQYTAGKVNFTVLDDPLKFENLSGNDNDELFDEIMLTSLKVFLYLINNPVIAGRTTHPPHKGLIKEIRNTWGGSGFPLHGWTEVKIDVTKTAPIGTKEEVDGTSTGRRPLHFVRKFMRIRRGQTEYVKAHYRGDPSIGIKQTRYNAVAPHRH